MLSRRSGRVGVGATGVALVALAGEWLAHTLEYLRVSGPRGAFGSAHLYMGPVGAMLLVAALVGAHSTMRLARRLERRLADLRRSGARPDVHHWYPPRGPRSIGAPSVHAGVLLAVVWSTQCGLYVLQENLETALAGHGSSGLAMLRGPHALVPVVQLVVAAALVGGLWVARREVTRLGQAVRLAEARLWPAPLPRPCVAGTRRADRSWTPIDRWGTQLWCRPPPAVGLASSA